jgi:hypothetical protein
LPEARRFSPALILASHRLSAHLLMR